MNADQIEALVEAMTEIAKAAVDDHEYRHSDYAGMEEHRAREQATALLRKVFQND